MHINAIPNKAMIGKHKHVEPYKNELNKATIKSKLNTNKLCKGNT